MSLYGPMYTETEYDSLWQGYSGLMKACCDGNLELVQEFCSTNTFNLNETCGWNSTTALILSCQSNRVDIVRYLLTLPAVDVNVVNDIGNSAFLVAAEEGHIEILELLKNKHADFVLQNSYGQTALLLATERKHLDVVKWLNSSSNLIMTRSLFNTYDNFGRTPLMVACELGWFEFVHWLLVVNKTRIVVDVNYVSPIDGQTALMWACMGTSARHVQICNILLDAGADVNKKSVKNDTALMLAALSGAEEIVEMLLTDNASVDEINESDYTALMTAAERGYSEIVGLLIGKSANKWIENRDKNNAMKLAFMNGHVQLATDHFMQDKSYDMYGAAATSVFTDDSEFEMLAKVYSTPDNSKALEALLILAAVHDFHFEVFVRLIPLFQSPNGVLNKPLPKFYEKLYHFSGTCDVKIVSKLVRLAAAIAQAIHEHPLEKLDLQERYVVVTNMLEECVISDFMDEDKLIHYILNTAAFSETRNFSYKEDLVERAQALHEGPLDTSITFHVTALFSSGRISTYVDSLFWGSLKTTNRHSRSMFLSWLESGFKFAKSAVDELVASTRPSSPPPPPPPALAPASPASPRSPSTLPLLDSPSKASASASNSLHGQESTSSTVMAFFRRIFSDCKKQKPKPTPANPAAKRKLYSKESQYIRNLKSNLIYARYRPAVMFFGEGMAKLAALFFLSHISANSPCDGTYCHNWEVTFLKLLTLGMAAYEYGQLCENNLFPLVSDLRNYVSNIWNCFDALGIVLLLIWMRCDEFSQIAYYARMGQAALSVSAIFFSFSVMRYFQMHESLGKLIIMVFAMTAELKSFAIIFLICVFGFFIALFGLFKHSTSFVSPLATFLSLFSATLSSYEGSFMEPLFNPNLPYATLGVVIYILFLTLAAVVLISLVIARMSAQHNKIDEESFQEWQFTKAETIREFILMEEKNPLCMLPPPLNLFVLVVAPFHHWQVRKAAATYDAYLKGLEDQGNTEEETMLMAQGQLTRAASFVGVVPQTNTDPFVQAQIELDHMSTILSLAGTCSDIILGVVMAFCAPVAELMMYLSALAMKRPLPKHQRREALFIFLFFPAISLFYTVSLILEACLSRTVITVRTNPDGGIVSIVDFEKIPRYQVPQVTAEDADHITFRILRGMALKKCTDGSNPIIKIRFGNMQALSGPSIYGGPDPQWGMEEMKFPIKLADLLSDNLFSLEVVDKDPMTGSEVVVGEKSLDIKEWISNGRFEGPVKLDDDRGSLQFVIKAKFPSLLRKQPVSPNRENVRRNAVSPDLDLSPPLSPRRQLTSQTEDDGDQSVHSESRDSFQFMMKGHFKPKKRFRRPGYYSKKLDFEYIKEGRFATPFVEMFVKDRDRIFLPALKDRGIINSEFTAPRSPSPNSDLGDIMKSTDPLDDFYEFPPAISPGREIKTAINTNFNSQSFLRPISPMNQRRNSNGSAGRVRGVSVEDVPIIQLPKFGAQKQQDQEKKDADYESDGPLGGSLGRSSIGVGGVGAGSGGEEVADDESLSDSNSDSGSGSSTSSSESSDEDFGSRLPDEDSPPASVPVQQTVRTLTKQTSTPIQLLLSVDEDDEEPAAVIRPQTPSPLNANARKKGSPSSFKNAETFSPSPKVTFSMDNEFLTPDRAEGKKGTSAEGTTPRSGFLRRNRTGMLGRETAPVPQRHHHPHHHHHHHQHQSPPTPKPS